jgi:acyl-CoA synthetase (AMP-forming)/AMP-acid ligase II
MSITQELHRSFQQRPDAVATICQGRVRTFREQHDRVARLAAGLQKLGLAHGDRVAIVGHNSDRLTEVLLAAAWTGAVFAPFNIRWTTAELAYGINDVGSELLVLDDAFAGLGAELRKSCPGIRHVVSVGNGAPPPGAVHADDLIDGSEPADDVHAAGAGLAGIFYTGGTTGHPKGVMLTRANLLTAALGTLAAGDFLEPGGTVLHVAPLFHLAGIWPWVAQLLLGGRHVILPAFEPDAVILAVREHEVTDALLVPTMIQFLVSRLRETGQELPSLRHLIYAGSPIPEALLSATEAALPGIRLTQGYGMTELAPVATLLRPDDHRGARRRSAGRAAPHSLVRIVDSDGAEVPRGEPGEVIVTGGQGMAGYWNDPRLTAETLRAGWMHTGDVGYMDADGYVYIVDRIKDMIISGGENVYSSEVENALAAHPAMRACAVIGVPDADWGEHVHAVVVAEPGTRPTLDELRDHVASRIARYKAPRSLQLVDALPVSATGKVLKRDLRAAYQQAGG